MHGAVVLVDARRRERYRVVLAVAAHDRTARERGRPERLDAVRDALRAGPRPGDGAAYRDRVHRRVRAPVVSADERGGPVVPHRHGPDGTATPAGTATTATTISPRAVAPVGAARHVAAAARERRERDQADDCRAKTHWITLLSSPACGSWTFPS